MSDELVVHVDPDVCMGMGYCFRTAPTVFAPEDGDGTVTLVGGAGETGPLTVPPELRGAAIKAAQLCPSGAIDVRQGDGS